MLGAVPYRNRARYKRRLHALVHGRGIRTALGRARGSYTNCICWCMDGVYELHALMHARGIQILQ